MRMRIVGATPDGELKVRCICGAEIVQNMNHRSYVKCYVCGRCEYKDNLESEVCRGAERSCAGTEQ